MMHEHWKPNHVVVIGAGAMGCLFGGLLHEGGLNVTLVDVWRQHVEAINRNGLTILGYGGDRSISVRATTEPTEVETADVVLVQCKAFHTTEALRQAAPIFGTDTVAISFQNGLGNEEMIGEVVGAEKVLGGLTVRGANVVEPGVIRNYSDLPTFIGELPGGVSARAERVATAFTRAGLETKASENIVRDIWKKLLINVGVSATSAVTGTKVSDALAVPEVLEVALEAVDEAAAVGKAAGVELDIGETRKLLSRITGQGGTGDNRSSMCVDLVNKRRTEIDYINGAIVQVGKKYGIPTPVNNTLVAIVKGLERSFTSTGS
jgi:2-dehydropantoate 2-reductase